MTALLVGKQQGNGQTGIVRDQTAGGDPGGNRERMPAAARRAVQIHAVRPDVQRLYGLLQQYRPVVALFGPLLHAAAAFPCLLKSMRIPG